MLSKLLDGVLHGKLWIALCSVVLCFGIAYNYNVSIGSHYVLFLFFSTWALYSLHTLIGHWLQKNSLEANNLARGLNYGGAVVAGPLAFYYFIMLDASTQWKLLIPISISIAYIMPLISKTRLRDVPYAKIFFIAICWALLLVWIPLQSTALDGDVVAFRGLEIFFFIFAITLPFDVRDYYVDKAQNVETITHWLGQGGSFKASLILLAIGFIIGLASSWIYGQPDRWILFPLSYALILFVLLRSRHKTEHDRFFYNFWLDGTMLWYGLTCLLIGV